MSSGGKPTTREAAIRLVRLRAKQIKPGSYTTVKIRAGLTEAITWAYELKASIRELSAASRRSYGCVHRWLRLSGVQFRERGGASREYVDGQKGRIVKTMLFDEVGERFPLGRDRGIIVPTVERISDTASTPLGLTLRAVPAKAEKWGPKPTSQATSIKSDGVEDDGTGVETQSDTAQDETW